MFLWYDIFIVIILLLWGFSAPQDRNALRIVLIASLASEAILEGITHQIHGSWKLVIPVLVEILTILMLLQWAKNRTGYMQVVCLAFALVAHGLVYADHQLRTDLIRSHYVIVIQWIAACQIAACYDTVNFNLARAYAGLVSFCSNCFRPVIRAILE